MKKGFTLVELLAVIVIIGVITIIAVPIITDKINDSKRKAYEINQKQVTKALELYMAKDYSRLPKTVGERSEVGLDTLISEGLLKPFKNPYGKDNCAGYGAVIKETDDYTYEIYLNCFNDIGSSAENKLLLSYEFSDFQEPTKNYFETLNLGAHPQGGITYAFVGMEDGWHKYSISGTGTSNTYPYTFNIFLGAINSEYPTSFSFMYKTNVEEKYLTFGDPRMVNIRYETGFSKTDIVKGDYREATLENVVPKEQIDGTPIVGSSGQSIYFNSRPIAGVTFDPNTDFLYFKNIQVERKPYSTEYTSDERTGLIEDSSVNNNDSVLLLESTPKWSIDETLEKPVYIFNGENSLIDTNKQFNFNKTDNFTVSFWIKIKDHSHKESAAAGIVGKGHWYSNTWDIFLLNNNQIRFEISGDPTRNGIRVINTPTLEIDKWYKYTATYENGVMKNYLNGEYIDSATYNGVGDFNGDRNVIIGSRINDTTRVLDGSLTDIKIYNRLLNEEEIKFSYNMSNID